MLSTRASLLTRRSAGRMRPLDRPEVGRGRAYARRNVVTIACRNDKRSRFSSSSDLVFLNSHTLHGHPVPNISLSSYTQTYRQLLLDEHSCGPLCSDQDCTTLCMPTLLCDTGHNTTSFGHSLDIFSQSSTSACSTLGVLAMMSYTNSRFT